MMLRVRLSIARRADDWQMPYHAAAQLLQQPRTLGGVEAGRRAPRADGLHRRGQQEWHARRCVRHRAPLHIIFQLQFRHIMKNASISGYGLNHINLYGQNFVHPSGSNIAGLNIATIQAHFQCQWHIVYGKIVALFTMCSCVQLKITQFQGNYEHNRH